MKRDINLGNINDIISHFWAGSLDSHNFHNKESIKKSKTLGLKTPILLVPMDFRQLFFTLLSMYVSNIVVLANEEVGCSYKLDILGEI